MNHKMLFENNLLFEDSADYGGAGDAASVIGVGYQIFKDVIDNRPDIYVAGDKKMKGFKYPWDNKSYKHRGNWKEKTVTIYHGWNAGYIDTISAKFHVNYDYNGHAIGNIIIPKPVFNDAWLWSLEIDTIIKPESITYKTQNNPAIAAVRIIFDYYFFSGLRSVHRRKWVRLFANGHVTKGKTEKF